MQAVSPAVFILIRHRTRHSHSRYALELAPCGKHNGKAGTCLGRMLIRDNDTYRVVPLRIPWLTLIVFAYFAANAGARTHRAQKPLAPADPAYVSGLAAATRFLHAWQTNDLENGMVLLSDSVRRSHNADRLEQFFSGGTERAFEIARGKGNRGRYSFPVVLVTTDGTRVQRKVSEIVIVNTGKNDWAVDKLP